MNVKRLAMSLCFLLLVSVAGWSQTSYLIIVGTTTGASISHIASALGGTIVDSIPGGTYLLSVSTLPSGALPAGVQYIENNQAATLLGYTGAVAKVSSATPPNFYNAQPISSLIEFASAHSQAAGSGVIVADINALVDYSHPALQGHLTSGYDFVTGRVMGVNLNQSSSGFLDQSSSGFLDQSSSAFLDQSTASFLDQSSASFLDASTPAHGHGTLVAGIIAAYAPGCMIMPLRAFDNTGQTDTFTIAKAISYAVQNGATVINMSFGLYAASPTLQNAIAYAAANNVVLVASAGNDNLKQLQYPAASSHVIGVAATNLQDQKALFSNYSSGVVVSAPGVNVIAPYPGGYYAVVSGTSFSAPIAAAAAALTLSKKVMPASMVSDYIAQGTINITQANPSYVGLLGYGRVDLYRPLIIAEKQAVSSSILAGFNGTPIPAGDYVWFNSALSVSGLDSAPVTLFFTGSKIQFSANGGQQSYNAPNAQITFSPTATSATTSFNTATNTWITTVPSSGLPGNTFLSGFALPVPKGGLPGGVGPITWTGNFLADALNVTVQWKSSAAVYTSSFGSDYNAIGVKPVDSNSASSYQNSDLAGTPENRKGYVTGGAMGGGGSNYTGSYSGTVSLQP